MKTTKKNIKNDNNKSDIYSSDKKTERRIIFTGKNIET